MPCCNALHQNRFYYTGDWPPLDKLKPKCETKIQNTIYEYIQKSRGKYEIEENLEAPWPCLHIFTCHNWTRAPCLRWHDDDISPTSHKLAQPPMTILTLSSDASFGFRCFQVSAKSKIEFLKKMLYEWSNVLSWTPAVACVTWDSIVGYLLFSEAWIGYCYLLQLYHRMNCYLS